MADVCQDSATSGVESLRKEQVLMGPEMAQGDALPIGLIGLGSWATRVYVPLLLERQDVVVQAVAARTEATRRRARKTFGHNIELYPDYADLLHRSGVETVMICFPPPLGAKAAAAAIESGKHVWVEPPFEEGADSDRMLEMAGRSERVFHPDLELRYLPVVGVLRDLASTGRLGAPRRVRLALKLPAESADISSYLFAFDPWYIDLIEAIAQDDAERVEVTSGDAVRGSPIQKGTAAVQYKGGVRGEWAFDFGPDTELSLHVSVAGSEGEAEADLIEGTYRHRRTGGEWRSGAADCSRPIYGFVGMRECLSAFFSAVKGEADASPGAREYRRLQSILSALQRTERQMISERLGTLESGL